MPKTVVIGPALRALLGRQDNIVSVTQLVEHGIGRSPISHRVSQGRWRWLLPGVVMTQSEYPTPRQRLMAAWLWAGPRCAIDGASACYWYGVGDRFPEAVHVVVPQDIGLRTRSFVVVRRSGGEIRVGARSLVPYVEPATALVVAARSETSERSAIAVLSRELQTGRHTRRPVRRAPTPVTAAAGCPPM